MTRCAGRTILPLTVCVVTACLVGTPPARAADPTAPLAGTVDELRIYDRALSPAEVAASHRAGLASLQAQQGVRFEAKPVGVTSVVFRKPPREIKPQAEGVIWVDAEDFSDYGGWLLDTQFVHLMGSAYLIAAGIGTPVPDATVRVPVARAGRYRVWVRTRNWLPDHSPGRFTLIVGKVTSAVTLGAARTGDWGWESAGEFDLPAGEVPLALHDLTGYYGRCDALILTSDLGYRPPTGPEEIRRTRSRLTGVPLGVTDAGEFDVVVVGAGAAGCCAALAAARLGARTALVQDRPVLGGNSSSELGVPINGAGSSHPNARETGIIEELGRLKAWLGESRMSGAFARAAQAETNLSVFLNQHVIGVQMAARGRIAAATAVDTLENTRAVYRGRMFIDCTGDGWVGYYAGARTRRGREARTEFGESLAPVRADPVTMSGCLMGERAIAYRAVDTGKPAPYFPPRWAPQFPRAEEFARTITHFASGDWWLERRGDIDPLVDAERSRDELLRITYGYWDYIKNTWPERARAANWALADVPIVEARRESRRLVGDYTLTQNDAQNAAVFPDRISYGGWPLDVHHPQGIYSGTAGPFDCDAPVPIYTIPFRCLYSQSIENLLCAGRDVSVTHIALGSVRVQGTLAALGQAAGTAAALALQRQTTPRGLYTNHMAELQQVLLKHDQTIPGLRNEDPGDLARTAHVSASSTARGDLFGREQVRADKRHALTTSRAVMFPRGDVQALDTVYLLLSSLLPTPTPVVVHVREATAAGEFAPGADLVTATAVVPPQRESWVEFKLQTQLRAPFVWVWLGPTEGLSWRLMTRAPRDACRAYGGGAQGSWQVLKGQYYAFYTRPALAIPADYRAENVTNGVARVTDGATNLWASDPDQPLPQWVELSFSKPVEMNTAILTFDTDLNDAYHTLALVPECVRDYELSCRRGSGWTTIASIRGNFQRRRVHHFDAVTTDALRLTVLATNGDRSARVFEVRAYRE